MRYCGGGTVFSGAPGISSPRRIASVPVGRFLRVPVSHRDFGLPNSRTLHPGAELHHRKIGRNGAGPLYCAGKRRGLGCPDPYQRKPLGREYRQMAFYCLPKTCGTSGRAWYHRPAFPADHAGIWQHGVAGGGSFQPGAGGGSPFKSYLRQLQFVRNRLPCKCFGTAGNPAAKLLGLCLRRGGSNKKLANFLPQMPGYLPL